MNVIYVADFFSNEILGGSELYGEELLFQLRNRGIKVQEKKSKDVDEKFVKENKNTPFIISNNKQLSEEAKKTLKQHNIRYIVLEHDHQYLRSNNPALYPDFIAPESDIINKDFYRNAEYILAQSQKHADIIHKNIMMDHIIPLTVNLWSKRELDALRKNLNASKTKKAGVMASGNKNKGTPQTIDHCLRNGIEYELIPFLPQEVFYEELAKFETLVFMPQWIESFCRVVVEARILGCKVITNKLVGVTGERFFKLKGEELLNYIESQKEVVINMFEAWLKGEKLWSFPLCSEVPPRPKITLISTCYNGEKYMPGFLKALEEQTYNHFEFILVDANSSQNEKQHFDKSSLKDKKYIRTETMITTGEAFNLAIKQASGELISFICVDDRPSKDYVEVLSKWLTLYPNIDLVYGDTFQTNKENETFEKNSSNGRLYEHSRKHFSKENMIKCLPGCMPMFRKSMIEKNGGFGPLKYASDWELWLRCVRNGSTFKKVDTFVGLYYNNPQGLSTNKEKSLERLKEERDVFYGYKDVLGEQNFQIYKGYFDQAK